MKVLTNVNRSGRMSDPTAAIPSDPCVPEIAFIPTATVLDRFKMYLVVSTQTGALELRVAESVLGNPQVKGAMLFITTPDGRKGYENCFRVHFVCQVLGLSKSGALPDGREVSTISCQVVLLPGQSSHMIPNPPDQVIKLNVPIEVMDPAVDAIYFRPSYDQLYTTPFDESYDKVRWRYAGQADDSPLMCSISTVDGASIANYTALCGRTKVMKLQVAAWLTKPGTCSLIMGCIKGYYNDDIYDVIVKMFDLVAITNYTQNGSDGSGLYWLGFEVKKNSNALRPNMIVQNGLTLTTADSLNFTTGSHQVLIVTATFI